MNKIISYEKLSKKEKKKINNSKRNTWGPLNPVSRVVKNKKKEASKNACRKGV